MTGVSAGRRLWSRRWPIPVAVVVLVVIAAVSFVYLVEHGGRPASGGSSPTNAPTADGIRILPSPGTPSACITGTPGVPRPTLNLDNGTLQANTYDVPSGTTGHVGMCYDAGTGALYSFANWTYVGGNGGWFSYPQVTYGIDNWDGALTTYTPQSASWALPQTVSDLTNQSVWFTTDYRLSSPNLSDVDGYDLSLDDFFAPSVPPPTFGTGLFVEVEVFLAHSIAYPFEWVHWTTPTLLNSTLSSQPWDVAYWCHGANNGSNGSISFDFSYGGQDSNGLLDGVLGLNLSALLLEVETLVPSASCWTGSAHEFSNLYLEEANIGSEDGADAGAAFNYNWTITAYCIHPFLSDAGPSSLECGGAGAAESRPTAAPLPASLDSALPVRRLV